MVEDDDYPEEDDFFDDDELCLNCGPSCKFWAGDGLCELAWNIQSRSQEYEERFVSEVHCPVCGKLLKQYCVLSDVIWQWRANFYNPLIALSIYGAYDCQKGIFHNSENIYHIWVGDKDNEKLVKLICA